MAGEYGRALAHPDHPLDDAAEAKPLFRREAVEAYLTLAGRGALRVRRAASPASGDHSRQIRIEVLALLAKAAGVYADLPPQPDPVRKQPVPKRARSLLRSSLEEAADQAARPGQVRMLAIGAMVADSGAPARRGVCVAARRPGAFARRGPDRAQTSGLERGGGLRRAGQSVRAVPGRPAPLAHRAARTHGACAGHHHGAVGLPAPQPPWRAPRPSRDPLEPRGLYRAWTRAVEQTNAQMAGEPSWVPLPTRMEQLRRGVNPKTSPAPRQPDAEQAVVLLDDVAACGRALAEVRRSGEPDTTEELEARLSCRKALRAAWAEGIEHAMQLSALVEAGLTDTADLTAAGWEPALLDAIERAAGWGRPSRAKTV